MVKVVPPEQAVVGLADSILFPHRIKSLEQETMKASAPLIVASVAKPCDPYHWIWDMASIDPERSTQTLLIVGEVSQ